VVRGDVGTVEAHLAVVAEAGDEALEVLRALGQRQVTLAERRGLAPEAAARLRAAFTRWP
jgi:hypothetical protein